MVGNSIPSPPKASIACTKGFACVRGRVTRMRLPLRGSDEADRLSAAWIAIVLVTDRLWGGQYRLRASRQEALGEFPAQFFCVNHDA